MARCTALTTLAVALWLPAAAAADPPATLSPTKRDTAARILADHLPCRGCHIVDDNGGGTIGPSLKDVGSRLSYQQIDAKVRAPDHVLPGTIMPRSQMREDWRVLLIRALAERGGASNPNLTPTPAVPRKAVDDGAALYAQYCTVCHGEAGGGNGLAAPNLPVPAARHDDPARMSARPDGVLYDTIAIGGHAMAMSPTMPSYGQTLQASEIWALVAHIRTLCSCEPPAWSTDGER